MNILEQLEENIEPSTKKEFQINIKTKVNLTGQESAEPHKEKSSGVIIKDKSRLSHLNRESIMERLLAVSTVKQQIVSQAPTPAEALKASADFDEFNESVLDISEKEKEKDKDTEKDSESESDEEAFEKKESDDNSEEDEEDEEDEDIMKSKKRTTRKKRDSRVPDIDLDLSEEPRVRDFLKVKIGKTILQDRLPPRERIIMRTSPYYMNNRKKFIQNISTVFASEIQKLAKNKREGAEEISCENTRKEGNDISLLTHQEVVRDYLNLYTPYRGLLLYHGLGSGKTCSSIAIAEGMKTNKRVIIMTPASLKMNFFSELKKCGDQLYRKNQFWEFIPVDGQPQMVSVLSQSLSLSPEFIKSKGGAWLTDISKPPNFGTLSTSDKKSLDEQINTMIRAKYLDINYNGLNNRKMDELGASGNGINPFDHAVVVIDEAHNLVSRISNKIGNSESIAGRLYEWLLSAQDVRIVLLTGTPIINYPHETGILFNILRGYIKTWEFQVKTKTAEKFNRDSILKTFKDAGLNTYDYVEYSGDKLTITRNPFGFINTYSDDQYNPRGERRGGANKDIVLEKEEKQAKSEKSLKSKTKSLKSKIITANKTKKLRDSEEPKEQKEQKEVEEPEYDYEKENMKIAYDPFGRVKGSTYYGSGPFEDYEGVILDHTGNMTDQSFEREIIKILSKKATIGKPTITNHKSLPDNGKQFSEMFIQATGDVIHIDTFKRRILGLTSYFRSAQEQLLPRFVKADNGATFHKVIVDMSPHQFAVYNKIRNEEREKEKKQKKKARRGQGQGQEGPEEEIASSYRIFSRAACNFTFPNNISRPMPAKLTASLEGIDDVIDDMVAEHFFNTITSDMRKQRDDYFDDDDEAAGQDIDEETTAEIRSIISKVKQAKKQERLDKQKKETVSDRDIINYQQQIDAALKALEYNPREPTETNYLLPEGLEQYSPKLLRVLENIRDPENEGLHLLYSQFRTIEGIGIMKLILEANGFTQFRISRVSDTEWAIHEETLESDKPKFILYTGTESAEEKEVLRNIYNSAWEYVPAGIVESLKTMMMRDRKPIEKKNFLGDIIKIMMITSSGAEGINLRNTRFVHIVEPYWNKTRLDQVIGRARRICSHQDLPEELRTVKVFIYISTLSKAQREDTKNNKELLLHDLSKRDGRTAFTTDETLYEISEIKDSINTQILRAIKETAIDCSLYNKESNPDDPLVCYGFGKVSSNQFGSHPTLEEDIEQPAAEQGTKEVKWKAKKIQDTKTGIEYAMNPRTREVYDLDSYTRYIETGGELELVGHIVEREERGKKKVSLELL